MNKVALFISRLLKGEAPPGTITENRICPASPWAGTHAHVNLLAVFRPQHRLLAWRKRKTGRAVRLCRPVCLTKYRPRHVKPGNRSTGGPNVPPPARKVPKPCPQRDLMNLTFGIAPGYRLQSVLRYQDACSGLSCGSNKLPQCHLHAQSLR